MKKLLILLMVVAVGSCIGRTAVAGEVLDRLLNPMVLDTSDGGINRNDPKTLTNSSPIGQTFTTGPNTVEISRIAIAVAWWTESWTQDETLVLTVWDAPTKTNRIAISEMPYKWREWESGVIMFPMRANVKPNTQYYFELTTTGGNGTIEGFYLGSGYEGGGAYEAGKPVDRNIWFEIHARPQFDRDAAFAGRFSNWNLDYPGLENVKAAVQAKDWEKATDELIAFYESNPTIVEPELAEVKIDPNYDLKDSDLALSQSFTDDEGNIISLEPDWNHFRTWRTRGGVGLTRGGLRGYLAGAYHATGDDKYAAAFNDMIYHFMDNLPNPLRSGLIKPTDHDVNPSPGPGIAGGSMGGSLGRGARMNQIWYYYSLVSKSPSFTRDVRAAMIFDMVDSAKVIDIQKGGGNRAAQMATALYEIADRHPELKQAKRWFDKGVADTFANLMETIRRDGAFQEPTVGYHCLVVNRYTRTLQLCKQWNLEVKPEWQKRAEKALEFILYSEQPDWSMPARGDAGLHIDGTSYLERMAHYYNRSDFLWAGTHGAEGTPPIAASWQFPSEGWYCMRSDWTPDARYMNMRNGYDGSHGHNDHLSITLSAYGHNFILDPGVYQYGTTETFELMSTRSHATVTVDNQDTNKAGGPNAFATLRTADIFRGTNTGYKGMDDVKHTRKVAFLKPDYWVVSDTVNGPGEHTVAAKFPLGLMPVEVDQASGITRTGNSDSNLMIVPCPHGGFDVAKSDYLLPDGGLKHAPMVSYSCKTALPASLGMVLYPYEGAQSPSVNMSRIADESYRVDTPAGVDYVCFDKVDSQPVAFDGESLVLRTAKGGVKSLVWVNGKSASVNGKSIASADQPVNSLELLYNGDMVTIISSSEEPSLKVAALGVKQVRVGNGPPKQVTGAVILPFGK